MSHLVLLCCAAASVSTPSRDARDFDPFTTSLERFVSTEAVEAVGAPLAPTAPLAPGAAPLTQVGRSQQRVEYTWGPQYWLSVGGYWVDGRYDTPNDYDYEEQMAFALDFGVYNWRGEMGIGLEGGLMLSSYEIEGDPLGGGAEDVDVWRATVGVRIADRGPTDSRFVPYARAGFMYRRDEGDTVRDDGIGWYAGLGCDLRLTPQIAVGPSLLFNEANSQNAREWLFGVVLTLGF